MLNEEKIKEAESNIKNYLEDGLIKKYKDKNDLILKILIKNCEESTEVAEIAFKNKISFLWTIVCSYYAMYYIANAVLYKIGYKVGDKISHKVTSDALIVFVRNKLKKELLEEYEEAKNEVLEIAKIKADELITSFDYEREKRSNIQYNFTEKAKEAKAKTSLERAKRFIFEIKKLLD